MAEIVQRDKDKWLVRIFLGRDSTGRTHYHNKVVTGTKKAAQAYARDAETKHDLGILTKPQPVTLATFLDQWLDEFKRESVRARTFEQYTYIADKYLKSDLGGVLLTELTARQIQNHYNALRKQGLSGRTIRYAHSVLSAALHQAVRMDLIRANPAISTKRPQTKKKEIEVFTPEEAKAFIKASNQDPRKEVFWFALATGTRPEEYLALTWSDLDLKECRVYIHQTIFFLRGGGWRFEDAKTDNGRRTISFDRVLANALIKLKRRQGQERLRLGPKYQNNGLVFATRYGKPLQLRNLTLRHLGPILLRAGISGRVHLYRLRHSYATLALLKGVDLKTVSEALGHTSTAFTRDTYQHVLPSMRRESADKIGRLLFRSL